MNPIELVYTLGDPIVTSFDYTVTQINACEYPVEITVDSSSFISHSAAD